MPTYQATRLERASSTSLGNQGTPSGNQGTTAAIEAEIANVAFLMRRVRVYRLRAVLTQYASSSPCSSLYVVIMPLLIFFCRVGAPVQSASLIRRMAYSVKRRTPSTRSPHPMFDVLT